MKCLTFRILLTISILSLIGCGNSIKFACSKTPRIPVQSTLKHKKLALVLGGGGAKGFAHVGVLEELHNAGIVPDVIIGCSAGSIVGGLYAANPDIRALKKLILNGKRSEIITTTVSDWPYSVYSKDKIAEYLKQNLKVQSFEQTKIPFIATATNLQYGNLTAFSTGDMIDPILASAAFPGIFAPIQIEDQYYVDCGVSDPVPVQVAKQLGFKVIVAVNIAELLPESAPTNMFGVAKRGLEICYVNQCKNSVAGADVVIDFEFKNIGLFTDEYNHYLYQQGRAAARKAIPKIMKQLK